jgi:hypothetical protein
MMAGLPPVNKGIVLLLAALLLVGGLSAHIEKRENQPPAPRITIYVVPAITDEKLLPTSSIPDDYISDEIFIRACPGEYEPASFVVRALDDITSLEAKATELIGENGSIPSSNVDIRVVKCWYQAGVEVWDINHKLFTPELLLKDDSLVNVEHGENYLKLTSGRYVWISEEKNGTGTEIIPIGDLPVKDSSTLQPVNIPKETNKQFWVTIKVPDDSLPGTYEGNIELRIPAGPLRELQLQLEVLPIKLSKPCLTYSLYYQAGLDPDWPDGSISSVIKSEGQMRAELEDLFDHGVTNPTVYQHHSDDLLPRVLELRNQAGIDSTPLFIHAEGNNLGFGTPSESGKLEQLKQEVRNVVTVAEAEGYSDIYFYGIDEATGSALEAQRPAWEAIHEAGGKVFVAGYTAELVPPGNFELVGDIQDLLICAGEPSAEEAAKWHSVGHKIFCYANPQVGEEKPETYRRNYGLLLWQTDYDGAMDFAYQYSYCNIWNDFDHATYRDHVFAYPTVDGVIDTIEWEGWREGVDDVKYLTTLLELIEEAKTEGKDASDAEDWLADLKSADLMTKDLNAVRSEMIGYILYFLEKETSFNHESAST